MTVEATSITEALTQLVDRHPDVGRLLFVTPGVLRPHVNVFLDERRVDGGDDVGQLRDGTELRIVPSIAGG